MNLLVDEYHQDPPIRRASLPFATRFVSCRENFEVAVVAKRRLRSGWKRELNLAESIWSKRGAGIWLKIRPTIADRFSWEILSDDGKVIREWHPKATHTHFLDFDRRGRVIFSNSGCLYAWEDCPSGKPVMIADLRENQFAPITPPADYFDK
ncbi:MAG TPA: hypothetical protein VG944_04040 [Fimbriimonas sp.]|nr:hypothetical protein [Fimbriimonas sp.]